MLSETYREAIERVRDALVLRDRGAAGIAVPVYRTIQHDRAWVGRAALLLASLKRQRGVR